MKLFSKKQSMKEIVSDMKVSVDNMSYHANELQKGINTLYEINNQQLERLEEMSSILNSMKGDDE